jgi:hypothetical protein
MLICSCAGVLADSEGARGFFPSPGIRSPVVPAEPVYGSSGKGANDRASRLRDTRITLVKR